VPQLTKQATAVDKADPYAVAIAKGVENLKKELPNAANGDAARALLVAGSKGYDVGTSLDAMLALLQQPATWDIAKAPSGVDSKALARLQFTSALAVAERLGKAPAAALDAAAKLLVADQKTDGSWQLDPSDSVGSPLAYGPILATWSARTSLIASGIQPDFFSIVQADRWIRGLKPENVLEAASTMLALELASDVMAENLRRDCLSILRQGQSAETGGWGPTVGAPPQVFDTAIAVLALSALLSEPRTARSAYTVDELKAAIANGKKFLLAQQKADGSWPETTAWPLLALLSGA
jgi:hypothetical protein